MTQKPADPGEDMPEKAAVAAPVGLSRWRRMWPWLRVALWVLAAPVIMAIAGAAVLIGQEVSAPSWVVRDVETRAAVALSGGSLEFGEMKVTLGTDLHPRLVVRNAVLKDSNGFMLANVPQITGLISPRGALQGRFLAQEVELTGAEVYIRRRADGAVAFAFDQNTAGLQAAGFVELMGQVDALFQSGPLEALEQVRAQGVIINYDDARAGRSWVVDDSQIAMDLRGDALAFRADLTLLSGRAYVTQAQITYNSPQGQAMAEVGMSLTNAAAPDIASQSPILAWLGVLDAPISGAMRGGVDATGALTQVSATLQIGAGELRPSLQTRPIPFQGARTYFTFDPEDQRLRFDLIEMDSDAGRVSGQAQAYLREFENGFPDALMGQARFSELQLAPGIWSDREMRLSDASVDFRMRLKPFVFDIGQAVVQVDAAPVRLSGAVLATTEGWSVALDGQTRDISVDQVLRFWPVAAAPGLRQWLADNLRAGRLVDAALALRAEPGAKPVMGLTSGFAGAELRFMRQVPPIQNGAGTLSVVGQEMALTLEQGHVVAAEGGRIDLSGSTMQIPQTGPRAPAHFDLALAGRATAMMSLLRGAPFHVMAGSDLPVSFLQGDAQVSVDLTTPLARDVTAQERVWSARADLRNLRSDRLVPGRVLTAARADLRVGPEALVVQGPMQLDGVGGDVVFSRALGPGSEGTARVEAELRLGPDALQRFGIALPDGMLRGDSMAQLSLDLSDPAAPGFRLTSDLRGTRIRLPGVEWSKPASVPAALTVAGQLGARPRIDQLSINAPGLRTSGVIRLAPGGGLERAAFERVRLGGWLDAPVILIGRGAGRPLDVQIAGGTLDLRDAGFGGGSGAGTTGSGGAGGGFDVALDRLQVTQSLALHDFRGQFTQSGGFNGTFEGLVNGAAPVQGTLVPIQGRSGVRIQSGDAGAVLRAAGFLRNAYGGAMRLTLTPAGGAGSFDGALVAQNLRVRNLPVLARLLDAISVVGLLTQLDGQGLLFTDIEAQFRMQPNAIIVTQSSAVGPSMGLSLDGVFRPEPGIMDFQGVISPIYLINGIGSFLTRPGEGLIGFNFNLAGSVDNPQVSVNPLSALTPGMFREIFRRPPPTVNQ